ncbi:winged helix-turn-helix domain-containing protein [Catellatospora citrea]|uniref:Transcriptional regulator n=1 Tax=Catellatospora citrea TaxID=53366 RepID=A0A8J3NZK2_9ACTN|nr:helix-turn-helix domain-containing protein [Catellatospora citrea]RKE10955.1 ArsR family transcriptional regulator [Catellatospora citrea]GIF96410.1 transcriptional regulator [Catellatospora citrea]
MDDESNAVPHNVVRLNAVQIRTLAHPLRARLLGLLRVDGPATATTLARLLDTNTGATSYHLRQLADVGLVAEETGLGTSRQRFWRAAHDASTWRPTDFDDDPDARAAAEWIESHQVRFMTEQAEQWLAAQPQAPQAWREAATISDAMLTVAPERLRALNEEIWELIVRYRQDPAFAEEEGAAQVHVFLASFPRAEELR